jgi:hypothetical protein
MVGTQTRLALLISCTTSEVRSIVLYDNSSGTCKAERRLIAFTVYEASGCAAARIRVQSSCREQSLDFFANDNCSDRQIFLKTKISIYDIEGTYVAQWFGGIWDCLIRVSALVVIPGSNVAVLARARAMSASSNDSMIQQQLSSQLQPNLHFPYPTNTRSYISQPQKNKYFGK